MAKNELSNTLWPASFYLVCSIAVLLSATPCVHSADSENVNPQTPTELYQSAREQFEDQHYDKAREQLHALSRESMPDRLSRKVDYLLGRILYEQSSEPLRALKHLHRVVKDHSPDNLTDDALYFISEILINKLDQPSMAVPYLLTIRKHLSDEDYHSDALKRLNELGDTIQQNKTTYTLNDIPPPRIRLNFEKIRLQDFIAMYAKLSGKNIMYEPGIDGQVSLIGKEGVPVHKMFDVFLNVLKTRGYTAIQEESGIYQIKSLKQAFQDGISTESKTSGLRTRLYSIGKLPWNEVKSALNVILPNRKNLQRLSELNQILITTRRSKHAEVSRLLEGLKAIQTPGTKKTTIEIVPKYSDAQKLSDKLNSFLPTYMNKNDFTTITEPQSNVILVALPKQKVSFVRRMAKRFDKNIIDRLNIRIFRLDHADEKKVVEKLKNLLDVLPGNFQSKNIKIVADDRQKAVIVSSVSKKALSIIERAVDELDKESVERPDNIRVFNLEYADPEDVANSLNQLSSVLPGEYPEGKMEIIPDERLQAVIVSAESRKVFPVIKDVIEDIDTKGVDEPSKHHVYKVHNSKAGPLAEKLNFLFKGQEDEDIRVTSDEQTNSLVISAPTESYDKILKTIKKLDSPKKQILVDVLIAEATQTIVKQLGVDLSAELNVSDKSGAAATQFGASAGQQQQGLFGLNASLVDPNRNIPVVAAVRALEDNEDVEVLSTAHLVANENEEASLSVGEVIPLLQDSQVTEGGSINRSFNFENVGTDLNIVPTLSGDSTITLQITQQIQDVTGQSQSLGAPTRSTRDINTRVSIPDNNTLVLGGILSASKDDSEEQVPYLGDIPGLEHLFQRTDKTRERTNLLILLTPHILTTQQDIEEATKQLREKQQERLEQDTAPLLR